MNIFRNLHCLRRPFISGTCTRVFSTESEQPSTTDEAKIGGYAKAFDKFEQINTKEPQKPQTFATLLRNSKFIDVSTIHNMCT